jgi:hypothetical protein
LISLAANHEKKDLAIIFALFAIPHQGNVLFNEIARAFCRRKSGRVHSMKFTCRTFLPLLIKGKKETLLSVYFQMLKEDLKWINDQQEQSLIISEIKRLITDNLDEIEKQFTSESQSYTRMGGSDKLILAFSVRKGRLSELIQLRPDPEAAKSFSQPNFHLIVWIFRKTEELLTMLPIEEI